MCAALTTPMKWACQGHMALQTHAHIVEIHTPASPSASLCE